MRALSSLLSSGSSTLSAKKSFDIRGGRCQATAIAGVRASLSCRVELLGAPSAAARETSAGAGSGWRGIEPKCFSARRRTSAAVVSPDHHEHGVVRARSRS